MQGITLKVVAIWEIDEEVEERFGDGYALDRERDSIKRGLRAVQGDHQHAVDDADRGKIVQAHDAEANEAPLQPRRSDHGGAAVGGGESEVDKVGEASLAM